MYCQVSDYGDCTRIVTPFLHFPTFLLTMLMCFVCRLFNVVWGKQSKKKHKTWEGDGVLEVGEKTVILKVFFLVLLASLK